MANNKLKLPEYGPNSLRPKVRIDANDAPGVVPNPELQGATFTGAKGLPRAEHEKRQG